MDDDEIDNYLYGEDHDSNDTRAITYQFEVCDSLLNIGPCGQVTTKHCCCTQRNINCYILKTSRSLWANLLLSHRSLRKVALIPTLKWLQHLVMGRMVPYAFCSVQ